MKNGIANATLDLSGFAPKDEFGHCDIDQIFITIYRFVNNVKKPRIVAPHAYNNTTDRYGTKSQEWIKHTERLVTGQWTDEGADDEYFILQSLMDLGLRYARQDTGRISKAMLEKTFGRYTIPDFESYEELTRDWPCMEFLLDSERPFAVRALLPPYGWPSRT